ncbi:uncharacterized protein LOC144865198 [Branchiostoma floridae x Branchiostoma japonicum]
MSQWKVPAEAHLSQRETLNYIVIFEGERGKVLPSEAAEPRMASADGTVDEDDTECQYRDHLTEGDSSLARIDLDSAEKDFAAALNLVHVRDPTAQQYQREVEPLCKLGDVYSKRGQQTGDGGDFVKAAALYNAAIARSEDQVLKLNIATAIKEIDKSFLKYTLGISCTVSQDDTEKHMEQLKEMRDQIKLEMETIDQQLDPYVHDEDDPCVREIEAKRAQAVRHLFENIAQGRKEFISLLVEECIGLMGPPPCKYAMIGLGSQATGLVTPYSDLEFAILVEEESEECLVYFRKLTHYLHLKVVNLGETILPALGIKSLNDFYSEDPIDNWYYDSVTPRGFAFDGSMPKASKTPLGRQGTLDKPPSELICTPENMVTLLQTDATLYLKEGYHLATILRNSCLIAGDLDLIDTYIAITVNTLSRDESKMAQQLALETLEENIETYSDKATITAKLINVKNTVYRFPSVAVDCLALSSGIVPTTVWETIEEMQNQQVISPNNAHHLIVLTSISAELRLRTYIANGGQKEDLSALGSIEALLHEKGSSVQTNDEVQANPLKPVFHLPNEKELFRYYNTAVPLKKALAKWIKENKVKTKLTFPDFFDTCPRARGEMYLELCKYEEAICCFNEADLSDDKTDPEKIMLLVNIGNAWDGKGEYQKAVGYFEQALEMYRYDPGEAHPVIAVLLNNLGLSWHHMGDQRKSISYHEQALQMRKDLYGDSTAYSDTANSLSNLGSAYDNIGEHEKAINYFEQALQMRKSLYGQTTAHPMVAILLTKLGVAWNHLYDIRKTISYNEQALQMFRSIYGQNTAHPDIASSLGNLGAAWDELGDYKKAISYHEQALQMRRSIYGRTAVHPDIALSLDMVGMDCYYQGYYKQSISYQEQALQMFRSVFSQTTVYPGIATVLNHLGLTWQKLGDYRKSKTYYEQALEMYRSIYGPETQHADIAMALNNVGQAWAHLEDRKKSLGYYEQALQMCRNVYGQSAEHPLIATFLDNLGMTWTNLGDHSKGISYQVQALQMRESIYGQGTPHIHIARSRRNIGMAWFHLGDYRKALSYAKQALQTYRSTYGQTKEHPEVAHLLNSIGMLWYSLGDYRKAIRYQEETLEMYRSINMYDQTASDPNIALSNNNLGMAWLYLGDYQQAKNYLEQTLQIYSSIYGQSDSHPEIARSINNIGLVWLYLGDYEKAISHIEEALHIRKNIYGQTKAHADIATSLNNMGEAFNYLDDQSKTISYFEQALEMRRSIYGENSKHLHVATTLNNLGSAWDRMGDQKKAIGYLEHALSMFSTCGVSASHPNVAMTLNNMGMAWCHLGDYRKGISYYERALEMYRDVFGQGTTHPDIARSLNNLGMAWYNLCDHQKALSFCQEALTMARQVFHDQNESHPLIKTVESSIVVISAVDGDKT